jgi:hypothetical protein
MITTGSGCAQIGAPTGGPRDTISPVLVKATPPNKTLHFTGNKIVLDFDEYVEVQDIQNNVLVSPLQKRNPTITYNFQTVTIRMRDTLLPNTTYTINFGDALKDLNEGNPLKDFTYIFSTGNTIDSMSLGGKVILAESGKTDSTLIVMLYRNANDSSVQKIKPSYIAKVKGDGSFIFRNLPPESFRVYALKDGDGGKTYNSKTEAFAFLDSAVRVSGTTVPVTLYAYQEVKDDKNKIPSPKAPVEKKLKYLDDLNGAQDLLKPLTLIFNNSIKTFDEQKVMLTDTAFRKINNTAFVFDSTRKKLEIRAPWQPEAGYVLLLPKEAVSDTAGNLLAKTDTIRFTTKRTEDYGKVLLRFKNADLSKHPVLQFVAGEEVMFSYPLTAAEWSNQMFPPGEYEIRILYDANNNGKWDPGNYSKKLQPEKAVTLPQKLSIRPNWDNERDITL